MTLGLFLSWCPVILAVTAAAWRLSPRRATVLSILCALFWVLILQAALGVSPTEPTTFMALLVGAVTIAAVGYWTACPNASATKVANVEAPAAGGDPLPRIGTLNNRLNGHAEQDRDTPVSNGDSPIHRTTNTSDDFVQDLVEVAEHFEEWLERARMMEDPWPAFGEFVRWAIHRTVGGAHIRPYRIQQGQDLLMPLTSADPAANALPVSARQGVLGHVATTGRTCMPGDPAEGPLVHDLFARSGERLAWCFAVVRGSHRLGVVAVGALPDNLNRNRIQLRCVERTIRQMWITLGEVCNHRTAALTEPVSGLPTCATFKANATQALNDSYSQPEPVAVAVIALEGMRGLLDRGDWDRSDQFIREVACLLQQKLRSDDHLGRLDDSRFLILLRRVDTGLASLITKQLVDQLETLIRERAPVGALNVRCGLVGSGTGTPSLDDMISQAMEQCHAARRANVGLASDMDAGSSVPVTSSAIDPSTLGESSGAKSACRESLGEEGESLVSELFTLGELPGANEGISP